MVRAGLLEGMAGDDLDGLMAAVGRRYRAGSLDRATAGNPVWREALEQAEGEVGTLYAALCEADRTLVRWRLALAELYRVWASLPETPAMEEVPVLKEVA